MGISKFVSGFKINKLTLVELVSKDNGIYKWKCLCDCGNYTIVRTSHLNNHKGCTVSCGCQKHLKNNAKDIKGQRFGRLVILERDFSERKDKKRAYWLCQCDCGKQKIIRGKDLLNNKILSCTCLLIEKAKERMTKYAKDGRFKGKNNWAYRHDLSPEERHFAKYRHLIIGYLEWVKIVKIRDNFICQICTSKNKLEVHHLESFSTNKDLRTEIKNGICLCRQCHREFHYLYGKKNNSRFQFEEFKSSFLII